MHRMKTAAAVSVALVLALCGVANGRGGEARSTEADRSPARVRTIATVPGRVMGFAHNRRYLAWLDGCLVVFHDLRSGARTRTRGAPCDVYPGALVLTGGRAYWIETFGSISTLDADLLTASVRDPVKRQIAYQSLDIEGPERLVPPRADGRSVYFWAQVHEGEGVGAPHRLRRFDGHSGKWLTGVLPHMQLLSAAPGRYAFGRALRTHDCAREPAWANDGRRIAFASAPGPPVHFDWPCRGGLWVMNVDDASAERIAAEGRNPDWSPDGTKLAYDVANRIVIADAAGGDARTAFENGVDPAWSPDGKELAFERQGTIVVGRVDGTGERVVALGGGEPDWSPAGSQLVFTRRGGASRGLAIVDADGTGARSLTTDYDLRPAWSPDARFIAYSHCLGAPESSLSSPQCSDVTIISVVAPDGSGKRQLAEYTDLATVDLGASWSPNSSDLVFARHDGYHRDGHIVRLDSGLKTPRPLTSAPPPRTPIEIHARNGRRVARVDPKGVAVALAVTGTTTAAIVHEGSVWRVEIYAPRRRSVVLAQTPEPELAASGTKLVLRSGRSIFVLDARTGSLRRIAVAAATPIGLSIVGNRIAWAESGKVTRIRAVDG
jgi:WD40-like Beta Propeller Repeat